MTSPPATVSITEIVLPAHANHYGTLFAGHALMLMAKAAFLAGRSVAQSDVVMASVGDAQFAAPVHVGSVLQLDAWVSRIGRSSMTVCVQGTAERLGEARAIVLKGLFDMVAVDAQGRPRPVPASYRDNIPQEITT